MFDNFILFMRYAIIGSGLMVGTVMGFFIIAILVSLLAALLSPLLKLISGKKEE